MICCSINKIKFHFDKGIILKNIVQKKFLLRTTFIYYFEREIKKKRKFIRTLRHCQNFYEVRWNLGNQFYLDINVFLFSSCWTISILNELSKFLYSSEKYCRKVEKVKPNIFIKKKYRTILFLLFNSFFFYKILENWWNCVQVFQVLSFRFLCSTYKKKNVIEKLINPS